MHVYVPRFLEANTFMCNQHMRSATSAERAHSHGFVENTGTSTIVVMIIEDAIPAAAAAADATTQHSAPAPEAAAATQPAAATASNLHTLGPNHDGYTEAPPAAGAAHVDTAKGEEEGAEAHAPAVSRKMTPAVAIADGAGAVDCGPLHMPLQLLLTMAAMILRLRVSLQMVYIHGYSHTFHSTTPIPYRSARIS